jgi:redox-sensing transcriptional repressor
MILGLDRTVRVAILGAGNLGFALADYPGFRQEGFAIVALFDTERAKIGRRSRGGVRIFDITEFRKIVQARAHRHRRACGAGRLGADRGQHVVQAGVRAILNFLAGTLKVPPAVKLKNVDLTVSLESLSFFPRA